MLYPLNCLKCVGSKNMMSLGESSPETRIGAFHQTEKPLAKYYRRTNNLTPIYTIP